MTNRKSENLNLNAAYVSGTGIRESFLYTRNFSSRLCFHTNLFHDLCLLLCFGYIWCLKTSQFFPPFIPLWPSQDTGVSWVERTRFQFPTVLGNCIHTSRYADPQFCEVDSNALYNTLWIKSSSLRRVGFDYCNLIVK